MLSYQAIDVPFANRHQCWFCGEPYLRSLAFPASNSLHLDCPHPAIFINACGECFELASQSNGHTIFSCRQDVKLALLKRYHKDLAIGQNWTQQELADAGFEGGNFAGFAKSAWFMYEVAKQRVNFAGWPIQVAGQVVDDTYQGKQFHFDGVTYPDIYQAVDFYRKAFDVNKDFVLALLQKLGTNKFAVAIRIARQCVGFTPQERQQVLRDL
ncbi:hypothetical protein [Thalassotalea maritima]|uniref:hypothetical protein n=1 Tax=Thalassotalea maritima TaxID=3242416 RepID=UPI003529C43C